MLSYCQPWKLVTQSKPHLHQCIVYFTKYAINLTCFGWYILLVHPNMMTFPNILFQNTSTSSMLEERSTVNLMNVLSSVIASVGVIANFTVVSVFVSNAKLRTKIPNIYIINQVRIILNFSIIFCYLSYSTVKTIAEPNWKYRGLYCYMGW